MEIQSLRTSANFVINAETVDFGPDTYYLDSYDDGTYEVSKNDEVLERGLSKTVAYDYFKYLTSPSSNSEDDFLINVDTVDVEQGTYYYDSYTDGTYGVSKNENVLERGLNRSQAGDYFQSLVSDVEDDALVRRNSRTSCRRV